MRLTEQLNKTGAIFFRWRSYFPVIYLPFIYFGTNYNSIPESPGFTWYAGVCLFTACLGALFRVLIIGFSPRYTSGRNVSAQRAHTLNTTGFYSIVRNPLYLANFIIALGIVLLAANVLLVFIHFLFFLVFYIPIIVTEEKFLSENFKDSYLSYCSQVPCIIPKLSNWKSHENPWSWRMVLRREPDSVLATLLCFVIMYHFILSFSSGRLQFNVPLLILVATAFVIWIPLKLLKRFTRLLKN